MLGRLLLKARTGWKLSLPDDAAAKWKAAGGSAASAGNGDLELFTPQLQGASYTLKAVSDARTSELPLCVLYEATLVRDAAKGTCRTTIEGAAIGTYPDPTRAKSWRVRMHKQFYDPPRFWMKITAANQDLLLAPRVAVGQMVGFITQKDKSKPKRRHTQWFPPNR
ncbi:MAG: hypothetical protein ACYTGB_17115, partial [Planctomycetota bacterium]